MSTGQQWWADKEEEYRLYKQDCKNLGIVPVDAKMEDYDVWEPHWGSLPDTSTKIEKPLK